jgi:hypothetical protein
MISEIAPEIIPGIVKLVRFLKSLPGPMTILSSAKAG